MVSTDAETSIMDQELVTVSSKVTVVSVLCKINFNEAIMGVNSWLDWAEEKMERIELEIISINNYFEMFRCKGETRIGVGKGSREILFLMMGEMVMAVIQ